MTLGAYFVKRDAMSATDDCSSDATTGSIEPDEPLGKSSACSGWRIMLKILCPRAAAWRVNESATLPWPPTMKIESGLLVMLQIDWMEGEMDVVRQTSTVAWSDDSLYAWTRRLWPSMTFSPLRIPCLPCIEKLAHLAQPRLPSVTPCTVAPLPLYVHTTTALAARLSSDGIVCDSPSEIQGGHTPLARPRGSRGLAESESASHSPTPTS
ncbi:hypothetical protein L1887_42177 [Cichorium endivia]|nr:hypothetical protein L1887_42177 [Cichorium endivia]